MIPKFPDFKKLEFADRNAVEELTRKYEPYSDFNFISLLAWDINDHRMISELNGNLVIIFTSYTSNAKFVSFIGTNEVEKTVKELIKFSKLSGLHSSLKLVPEESVDFLKDSKEFLIEEDNDNFDYIFNVSELASLKGTKFKSKRRLSNGFIKKYPESRFELKKINNENISGQILLVYKDWKAKKKENGESYSLGHEEMAINRVLKIANQSDLIISCLFLGDKMVGFSIDEIVQNQCAISHFIKADDSYNGIYDFLNNSIAKYLDSIGVKTWNWEQDLGIENLIMSKTTYRPANFLKKYNISLISNSQQI